MRRSPVRDFDLGGQLCEIQYRPEALPSNTTPAVTKWYVNFCATTEMDVGDLGNKLEEAALIWMDLLS